MRPRREVLGAAGTGEEVVRVELDLADVARVREAFPVLRDRVL